MPQSPLKYNFLVKLENLPRTLSGDQVMWRFILLGTESAIKNTQENDESTHKFNTKRQRNRSKSFTEVKKILFLGTKTEIG